MRTGRMLAACCFVLVTVAACKGQATTAPQVNTVGTNSATTVVFPPPSTSARPTLVHPSVIVPPPIATAPIGTTPVGLPPVSRPPSTPAVPGQPGSKVPPTQVDTSGMLRPPESVQVTHGGRYVVFTDEEAGCQRISAKATSQTATSVTITVTTTTTSHGSQVCPMYVREVPIVVVLDAPLGHRMLVFKGITRHG